MGKEDGFRTSRALSDGPTFYTVVGGGKRPNREKVGKDRQAADRRLREIWTQVDAGSCIPPRRIRCEQWAERWLAATR